jgi:hypothetical protein
MKILIPILGLSAGLLAAISLAQWQKNAGLRREVADLVQQNEEQTKQLQDVQTARVQSEQQRDDLLHSTAMLQEQVRTQQLAASVAAAKTVTAATAIAPTESGKAEKAGLGNFLSKMMQDPDAKKFIRDQQRLMMDQMYAPLLKRLNLSADEAAQFKDMLSENMMSAAEKATALFGASATNRAELTGGMAADEKAFEERIKTFLGEDRFAKFKEYQETVADRTQLNQFKQQSPGDYPLTDVQTEQLLTFIKEERRSVATATGQNPVPTADNQHNLEAMLSPDQAEKLMQTQETVNQRVFERARMILSPEQLQSLGTFQTNQMQTMRMGMSMARKLFTPAGPEAPGAEGSQ